MEFQGLKGQYIAYLAVGLVTLLILFALLYIAGVNMYLCLFLVLGSGATLFMTVFHLSHTYGQYGLMKKRAKGRIPAFLKFRSRQTFFKLSNHAEQ